MNSIEYKLKKAKELRLKLSQMLHSIADQAQASGYPQVANVSRHQAGIVDKVKIL